MIRLYVVQWSALHKIPVYEDVTLSMLNDLIAESNMSTYVTAFR